MRASEKATDSIDSSNPISVSNASMPPAAPGVAAVERAGREVKLAIQFDASASVYLIVVVLDKHGSARSSLARR